LLKLFLFKNGLNIISTQINSTEIAILSENLVFEVSLLRK